MSLTSVQFTKAKQNLSDLVSKAEKGEGSMILRNSKEAAAIISATAARLVPLVEAVIREFGESIEVSHDPDVLEAYHRGLADLEREDIIWYDTED